MLAGIILVMIAVAVLVVAVAYLAHLYYDDIDHGGWDE